MVFVLAKSANFTCHSHAQNYIFFTKTTHFCIKILTGAAKKPVTTHPLVCGKWLHMEYLVQALTVNQVVDHGIYGQTGHRLYSGLACYVFAVRNHRVYRHIKLVGNFVD